MEVEHFPYFVFMARVTATKRARVTEMERKRFDSKQIAFEIQHTVMVVLIGTCTAVAISLLYAGDYTPLTTNASGHASRSNF
jgi:protein-S-isoprenylcysteine O-methyltransferase Ste14